MTFFFYQFPFSFIIVFIFIFIQFRTLPIVRDVIAWQNSLTPGDTIRETMAIEDLMTFLMTMEAKHGKKWMYKISKDDIIIEDPLQFAQDVYGTVSTRYDYPSPLNKDFQQNMNSHNFKAKAYCIDISEIFSVSPKVM